MKHAVFGAIAMLAFSTAAAGAQERTEVGMLDCLVEGNVGLIVGSSRAVSCTFHPADGARPPEAYSGVINRYGLDIGVTGEAIMQWLVLAPTAYPFAPGALAGDYVGASGEITAAVGGGANILVGGSQDTFTLQPISVQGQTGLNLALGVAEFHLRSAQ